MQDDIAATVSIGVGTTGEPITIDDLLKSADLCLYKAKRSGRNRVCTIDALAA